MIDPQHPLLLGSASPRRREILATLGLPLVVLPRWSTSRCCPAKRPFRTSGASPRSSSRPPARARGEGGRRDPRRRHDGDPRRPHPRQARGRGRGAIDAARARGSSAPGVDALRDLWPRCTDAPAPRRDGEHGRGLSRARRARRSKATPPRARASTRRAPTPCRGWDRSRWRASRARTPTSSACPRARW